MPTYRICRRETSVHTYEVVCNTIEEAMAVVREGKIEDVDGREGIVEVDYYPHLSAVWPSFPSERT